MGKRALVIGLSITFLSCAEKEMSIDSVLKNFAENSKNLTRIEYNIVRIDTFASGSVWNNSGYALIERNKGDKLFGFYFFGERYDWNKQHLYDGKMEFEIDKTEKTYTLSKPHQGFLGWPGGQMVVREILFPDTLYTQVRLLRTTDSSYLVEYQFEDDTVYNVLNKVKVVELNKKNFLPQKVTYTFESLGNRAVHQTIISNSKINAAAEESLDQLKRELADYELVAREKSAPPLNLVDLKAPEFDLPLIFDPSRYMGISSNKLTLIDFWEVWCGPCIKSLPEVEQIHNSLSSRVEVIGITSDDIENAKKLVNLKKITFPTLIGDEAVFSNYDVHSYPRYVLIDESGIVRNVYYGFSSQIEEDIGKLLSE